MHKLADKVSNVNSLTQPIIYPRIDTLSKAAQNWLQARRISPATTEYLRWEFYPDHVVIPFLDPNDPAHAFPRYRKRFYNPGPGQPKEIWGGPTDEPVRAIYHTAGLYEAEQTGTLAVVSGPVDLAVYITVIGDRAVIAIPESTKRDDLAGFLRLFPNIRSVVMWPDRDATGLKHAQHIRDEVQDARREFTAYELPDLGPKTDLGDFLAAYLGPDYDDALPSLHALPILDVPPTEKPKQRVREEGPAGARRGGPTFGELLATGKWELPTYKPLTEVERAAIREAASDHPLLRITYPDWQLLHLIQFLLGLKNNKYVAPFKDHGGAALAILVWHELVYSKVLKPDAPISGQRLGELSLEHNRYFALTPQRAREYLAQAATLGLCEGLSPESEHVMDNKKGVYFPAKMGRPAKQYVFRPFVQAERELISRLTQYAALEVAHERPTTEADPRPYVLIEADRLPVVPDRVALNAARAGVMAKEAEARDEAEKRLQTARKRLWGWLNARGLPDRRVPLPAERVENVPDLRRHLLMARIEAEGDDFNPSLARTAFGYGRTAFYKVLASIGKTTRSRSEKGEVAPDDMVTLTQLDRKKYGFARISIPGRTSITLRPGESLKVAACELAGLVPPGQKMAYEMQLTPEICGLDELTAEDLELREQRREMGRRSAELRAKRGKPPGPRHRDRHPDRFGDHFLYWQVTHWLPIPEQQECKPSAALVSERMNTMRRTERRLKQPDFDLADHALRRVGLIVCPARLRCHERVWRHERVVRIAEKEN